MQRVQTTVIAVVGAQARALVEAVGGDANAKAVVPSPGAEPLDRAVEAWTTIRRTRTPFALHDADPLADVADAWVAYYDESAPRGDLEVVVAATVQRWRAGSLELPDLYVVTAAEDMPATRRHFWLGFLHEAAPARVVPARPEPAAVRQAVARLRARRWWPDLDRLLDGIERVVPDRVGLEPGPGG